MRQAGLLLRFAQPPPLLLNLSSPHFVRAREYFVSTTWPHRFMRLIFFKKVVVFRQQLIPAGLLLSALLLGGCAITPAPIQRDELKQLTRADHAAIHAQVAPLSAPLTLSDAIARALKYNLEHRTKLWEQALAVGQLDAGRFDMLPRMLANVGYNTRDQDATSWAPQGNSGQPSSTPSPVASDRGHVTYDLGLTWSILDFGLSYYSAQQNADRVLIAAERRRKAVHSLIQNVRTAFWRAASAQKLASDVSQTIQQAEAALEDAHKVELERVKAPAEALRYQRTLLENLRTLEGIERELAAARIELASLINLPPGTDFLIAEPSPEQAEPRPLALSIERMEELALSNNADLRESAYNARISAVETRKVLLRLFPNLSFSTTAKHDSNSFLMHQRWNEVGLQASWNILGLLSGPAQMEAADTAVKVAESRRMAVQMAVLTQSHLAARQYDTALRLYRRAHAIWRVDNRLSELTARAEEAQTQSLQARIAARTSTILSQLRRYQAMAAAHEAASKLQSTLGLDPEIGSLDDIALPDLARQIEGTLNQWQGQQSAAPVPAKSVPPAPITDRKP
jgi:outer membrane protein TolC